jgi:hypothetical protein
MLPDQRMPEDEVCPVRDELLGELYCAAEHGVSDLVASVAPDIRALLALYCYRRSHLHTRGVAIAASVFGTRRTITLATGPLRKMLPIDDEPDEEDCEPV